MKRLASLLGAAVVAGAVACTAPRISEDSDAACSNGLDDDGDGLVDCADPACASTTACELDASTCSNGLDDDGDGLVDCEQKSCVTAGFCASVPASCDVVRSTGCARGLACEPVDPIAGTPRVCALPGVLDETKTCAVTPSDPSGGCRAGTICYGNGLCTLPCEVEADCPRSATCVRDATKPYGVCSLTCMPSTGCVPGYTCIPFQRIGSYYRNNGWMHTCVSSEIAAGLAAKTGAKVGAPCADAALTSTPPATVCESGLLCVPGPTGAFCREVCLANPDGSVGRTCASGGCVTIDPFDQRPPRPAEPYRFGVCL